MLMISFMQCWFYILYAEPDDPRKVIVKKLALCVPERPDIELDLTGDLSQLKKQVKRIILKADWCFCVCVYVCLCCM